MADFHEQVVDLANGVDDDSATNGVATAILAAPGLGHRWIVTGYMVSADVSPVATVTCSIKENAVTKFSFEVPASTFAAIHHNFVKPLRFGINLSASIVLPALGSSVTGHVVILGYRQTV